MALSNSEFSVTPELRRLLLSIIFIGDTGYSYWTGRLGRGNSSQDHGDSGNSSPQMYG